MTVLVVAWAAAACSTSSAARGQTALRHGDYAAAASEFEDALTDQPDRLDALIGLGIARYKLGAFADARNVLDRAAATAPRDEHARLYLGLTELQDGNVARAVEHLRAFRARPLDPRVAAFIDRSLPLLESPGITADLRRLVAATLEDEVSLARELQQARLVPPPPAYAYPFPWLYDCVPVRRGRLVCL
jgi:tetratricopeptide (TPR) repeat protein